VERLRVERERSGERRVARVLERLLAWHGALVRLSSAADEAESPRWWLELDAAAVELDVLTNGWFGERVERLELVPSGARESRASPPEGRPSRQIPVPARATGEPTPAPRRSLLNPPGHACRCTERAHGPSEACRCAKGVSLTSRVFGG
jgi:hypothetical protein